MRAIEEPRQQTTEAVGALAGPTWPARHPVLSRALLYGLGLALGAGLLILLALRRGQDARDVLAAKAREMENLSVVLLQDPSGEIALKVLDERFPLDELPAALHALRYRMTALALRQAGKTDDALAMLAKARTRAQSDRDRLAIDLEEAEALLLAERYEATRKRLSSRTAPMAAGQTGIILASLLGAESLAREGRTHDAWAALNRTLADMRAPLASAPTWDVGGHAWTETQAAYKATARLSEWAPGQPEPWRRLVRLAASDVRVKIECARGLFDAGDESSACNIVRMLSVKHAADIALYVDEGSPLAVCLEKNGIELKRGIGRAR